MNRFSPDRILWIGFALVLLGAVLPFLMVLKIIPVSLGVCFLSFLASMIGLFLGLVGAATLIQFKRPR